MVRGQCHPPEIALEEVAIIVGQLLPGAVRAQMAAQRRHDERVDLGGGNAADQSGRRRLILQHSLGDVIAVAGAALVGVSWAHAVAAIVKKAPAQERGRAPQPTGRARAWAASLACTAANSARSTIGACSPPWTSPR